MAMTCRFYLEDHWPSIRNQLIAGTNKPQPVLRVEIPKAGGGVLVDGLVGPTDEGTPQGGPLSLLLSNLMLDVLDKELTRRGSRFVRYGAPAASSRKTSCT
jgi:RNA-directed DNA polymerase